MRSLQIYSFIKIFAIVTAELSLGSYSYRYLSSKISVTTQDIYNLNEVANFEQLPEDGAYGGHSSLRVCRKKIFRDLSDRALADVS